MFPLLSRLNGTPMKVLPCNKSEIVLITGKKRAFQFTLQVVTYSSSLAFARDASDQIHVTARAGLGTAAHTQSCARFSANKTGGMMNIQMNGESTEL